MDAHITERLGAEPVLCAVGAGEHGEDVTHVAAALAARAGAPLRLLHVVRERGPRGILGRLGGDGTACAGYRAGVDLLEGHAAGGATATSYRVLEGHAADEILLAVAETRPPVLVLGSRGRSLVRDLIGRISHTVRSRTAVATLVVPRAADPSALDRGGPVVCGIDGSRASARAAGEAAGLAEAFATDLVLAGVAAPRPALPQVPAAGVPPLPPQPGEIERERRRLRDAAQDVAGELADGVRPRVIVDTGEPAIRLDAIAAELDACLIVVGDTTGSALGAALRVPVGPSLCADASRPVLVVPRVPRADGA